MTADIRLLRWPEQEREDYERLAQALERVRRIAAASRGEIVVPAYNGPEEPTNLDRVRALYAQRRHRDSAAGPDGDLFADPAWDLLLALFIAREEGRWLTEADACAATCVAPAAALRWLGVLGARGLVMFGRNHGRGQPAMLTHEGHALVIRCVGAM